MSAPVLGVDIGGTSIKWAAVRPDGAVAQAGRLETPSGGPQEVVEAIARLRHALLGAVDPGRLGIAVPGHLDRATGRTGLIPNVPGDWAQHPFRDELARAAGDDGLRVELLNDVRAFASAEIAIGSARGATTAVFAAIGTGLGGALAVDGSIVRDRHDAVGEIGHLTVVMGGEPCGCGSRGCAEAYVGVRALERRTGLPIAVVRRRVDAGDPDAVERVRESANAFATAVANAAVLMHAPLVIVGGGIGTRWPEYAVAAREALARRHALLGRSTLVVSQLGDHAGAIGAAIAALHTASEEGTP